MNVPSWARELKKVGFYYEGFVEDIDSVRQKHQAATVSTYGIRRSRTNNYKKQEADDASCSGKENKVGITYSKGVKLVLVYTGLSS